MGNAAPVDPAVIAALTVALDALASDGPSIRVAYATPPWRAAGRSIEAFDAYDAARHDRDVRRGGAR